jgi:hypothetical protein
MLNAIVESASNWLNNNHPQAKTRAEQAEALGISTTLWQSLVSGDKSDIYLSTVGKILERIEGDLRRAFPDYTPERDLGRRPGDPSSLKAAIARTRIAEAERREIVMISGTILENGEIEYGPEEVSHLDEMVETLPHFDDTDGPTRLFVIERQAWVIVRTVRPDTPLTPGMLLIAREGQALRLCELMRSGDSWALSPVGGPGHTLLPWTQENVAGVVVGSIVSNSLLSSILRFLASSSARFSISIPPQ